MEQGRGWYPDPESPRHRRYFDGYRWTGDRILTRAAFWRRTAGVVGAGVVVLLAAFVVVGVLAPQPSGTAADRNGSTSTGTATTAASSAPAASRPAASRPASSRPASSRPAATAGTALAAAEQLTVKGRAPKTGYSRDQFGSAWVDTDGNGCDQREDVLNRDLTAKTFDGCLVLTGTLHDPYTGRIIHFQHGETTSAAVQIDHVVAESDAWQKGAQQWSAAKRLRFATDTLNLFAVDGPTNASKGDGDTATWLPPDKTFRCTYVAHQVAVKRKYGLWVTQAERDAMIRELNGCPTLKLPTRAAIPSHPAAESQPHQPPTRSAGGSGGTSAGDSGGGSRQCAPGYDPCVPPYPPDVDCADVDGPIRVTGSDPHRLDGDHDGIACES